ncbi:MAG: beta-propeller domain-containing protein [Clostridia bacterium]
MSKWKKSGLLLLISSLLVFLPIFMTQAAVDPTAGKEITLHMGSPLALVNGEISQLDSKNIDVAPRSINNRTLVPLRAISEHFDAVVSFNGATKKVTIKQGDKEAVFTLGQKYYYLNGNKYQLDVAPLLADNRVYVPLRVIGENVLGQSVAYYDGVIYLAATKKDLALDKAFVQDAKNRIGQVVRPASMAEFKKHFYQATTNTKGEVLNGGIVAPVATDQKASVAGMGGSENAAAADVNSPNYSTTNVQIQGIDEADVVKTDGRYIYASANQMLYIYEKNLQLKTKLAMPTNINITDFFLDKNMLIINGNRFDQPIVTPYLKGIATDMMMPRYYGKNFVSTLLYDLTDISEPKLVKVFEIEGNQVSTRKNGNYLYTVTNKYSYNYAADGSMEIMPAYRDGGLTSALKTVGLNQILSMPVYDQTVVSSITVIDITKPEQAATIETFNGSTANIFMSDKSLYLVENIYEQDKSQTNIIRFSLQGMQIGYGASTKIPGTIINQFSMNELKDNFTIATNIWQQGNNVYVLDQSLQEVGKLEGLAKGEQIYAVRFVGDTAYIVTFKTMDPLFIVDLSNPKSPTVKGELKIPGFSNYLHPISDTLLLGIGQDTQELFVTNRDGSQEVVGTRQAGMKISLFDVSNPNNPVEKDAYYLGKTGTYAEVLYNHKALMTNPTQNLFAFDANIATDNNTSSNAGLVFKVIDNKILLQAQIKASDENSYLFNSRRLCYIDNTIYYIQNGSIHAYEMNTYSEIAQVVFN